MRMSGLPVQNRGVIFDLSGHEDAVPPGQIWRGSGQVVLADPKPSATSDRSSAFSARNASILVGSRSGGAFVDPAFQRRSTGRVIVDALRHPPPEDRGGTNSAPRPRERRKPSSTAHGLAGCLSCAQHHLPPCRHGAAISPAFSTSSSNCRRFIWPKNFCKAALFHKRMPEATHPARSSRQVTAPLRFQSAQMASFDFAQAVLVRDHTSVG